MANGSEHARASLGHGTLARYATPASADANRFGLTMPLWPQVRSREDYCRTPSMLTINLTSSDRPLSIWLIPYSDRLI